MKGFIVGGVLVSLFASPVESQLIQCPTRELLEEQGIVPYVTYTGETFSAMGGGLQRGTHFNGLLDFGIDIDLEKAMGWSGAAFHANAFYYRGNDLSADFVGDFGVVSNIITSTEFNLYTIYFEQAWLDDAAWIRLGQLAVDDDFTVTDVGALFLNANFGAMPLMSANVAAPIFSVAAPGVVGGAQVSERARLLLGVYAGDAGPAESSNHGFDWRLGGGAGYVVFYEGQLDYTAFELPGVFKLGGYYATGLFDDFAKGTAEYGNDGYYFVVDQSLLLDAQSEPKLNAFVRLGTSGREERNTVHTYIDCGLTLFSPLPERDEDVIGLAFSFTEFGNDYVDAENAAGSPVTGQEAVLECTYKVALAKGWTLQPDVQYIWDTHTARADAWVLGVRTEVSF